MTRRTEAEEAQGSTGIEPPGERRPAKAVEDDLALADRALREYEAGGLRGTVPWEEFRVKWLEPDSSPEHALGAVRSP